MVALGGGFLGLDLELAFEDRQARLQIGDLIAGGCRRCGAEAREP